MGWVGLGLRVRRLYSNFYICIFSNPTGCGILYSSVSQAPYCWPESEVRRPVYFGASAPLFWRGSGQVKRLNRGLLAIVEAVRVITDDRRQTKPVHCSSPTRFTRWKNRIVCFVGYPLRGTRVSHLGVVVIPGYLPLSFAPIWLNGMNCTFACDWLTELDCPLDSRLIG